MALRELRQKKFGPVLIKSGNLYAFTYKYFENDPVPLVLCISCVEGLHPTTHKRHSYMMGVNLSYIPRNFRKQFGKNWQTIMENSKGKAILPYRTIKSRYPMLEIAIRKYLLTPVAIGKLREIPIENLAQMIAASMNHDFSYTQIMKYYKNSRMKKVATTPVSPQFTSGR
jgi:hypothetical protein